MKTYFSIRKFIAYTKVVLILIMFTSCARSLHPLSEEKEEMIFKKELLGNWRVIKENGYPHNDVIYIVDTVENTGGRQYQIKIISKDPDINDSDTSYMLAFMVKLDQDYFINCSIDTARESYQQLDEMEKGLLINSHIISRIKIIDHKTISNYYIDVEELDELIIEKKVNLNVVYLNDDEDDVLLLDTGSELQKKLNKQGKFISVFRNEEKLKRF